MVNPLQPKQRLARLDAYGVASIAMDRGVAPYKDCPKTVHCMTPKSIFTVTP